MSAGWRPPAAESACCYFSAKDKDILQPAQKVFITWDPVEKVESFTVQPKFEGNADDFGMVIPTPAKPKLDEMPRDFFKRSPSTPSSRNASSRSSKLLPQPTIDFRCSWTPGEGTRDGERLGRSRRPRPPTVKVLEAGVVGTLDYKIIEAGRADDLFTWLKENKYSYAGDEATLDFYIKKKWLFTVMKIDTMQMKTQTRRLLRRRGHAHPLPVRQREARLPAEDHADLASRTRPRRCSTCRPRTRSTCPAT